MPKQRNAFRLGLTMIAIMVLFVGVLFFIAGQRVGGQRFTVRFAHDDSALPILKPGGEVRCGGKQVGRIRRAELREAPPAQLRPGQPASRPRAGKPIPQLYLYIEAEVDQAVGLRKDCRVVAEGPALGGSGWLVIESRGTSADVVTETDVLRGEPPGGFAALTKKLNELAASMQGELDAARAGSLMATIKAELDAANATSLLGKIHRSVDDLNFITATMNLQFDTREQAALLAKLHQSLNHVNEITGQLREQISPARQDAIIAKVHTALDSLNAGLGSAVGMLDESRQPLRDTIAHVRSTSEKLDARIAEQLARQLDPDNAASLLAKIHLGIDRMNASLADINQMTDATRQVIVLNREKVDELLGNFKETSDHLKAASKDIRRNPWRLLYRPTLEETKQLDIFDAARAFAEAATQLDDAVAELRALADMQQGQLRADDPQLLRIRSQLQQTFEKFSKAEAALWRQLNIQ